MAFTGTQITGRVATADNANIANTSIEFVLTGFDTDNDNDITFLPEVRVAEVDDSGDIDITLYPNDDSERTRYYRVTGVVKVADRVNRYDLGLIELEAGGPYDLNDILRVDDSLPASLSIQQKLDLKGDLTAVEANAAAIALLQVDRDIDADAKAWLDAVGGTVSPNLTTLVNSTVTRLKLLGVWNFIDVINIDFGISEQAALRNLKDPTNLHTNNGATYSLGGGFAGDGSSDWIDTGLDASGLGNFALNSAHLGVWVTTDVTATERDIGFTGGADTYLISRSGSNAISGRVNDGGAISEAVSTSVGFSGINRSGAAARELIKDGVQVDSDTEAATALEGGNLSLLRGAGNYSSRTVWAYTAGGSLTIAQWSGLYEILNDARNGVSLSIIGMLSGYAARTKAQPVSTISGAFAASMNNGHGMTCTLSENVTSVTINDWPDGISQARFLFTQDATGGRTVTFPAGWVDGPGTAPAPATTANYVTEIIAYTWDGGTTVRLSQGDTWDG